MPINVVEAIDSDTAVIVTIEDKDGGDYVDGIFIPNPTPTTRKALASVQQPTPEQLNFLEGGERNKDLKSFYLNKPVKTAEDGTDNSSVVIHRGKRFKIIFVGDWQDFGWLFAIGAKEPGQ